MLNWIRNLIHKNETAQMLVENYTFRTIVFSVLSVLVAIGLAVFYIVIYAITKSLWCGAMAFYHIVLALLRGFVLLNHRKRTQNIALTDEEKCLELSNSIELVESYSYP